MCESAVMLSLSFMAIKSLSSQKAALPFIRSLRLDSLSSEENFYKGHLKIKSRISLASVKYICHLTSQRNIVMQQLTNSLNVSLASYTMRQVFLAKPAKGCAGKR